MPLTNAQLQARYRQRREARLTRYQQALENIANASYYQTWDELVATASEALVEPPALG